jgi:hypothetical protein
MGGQLTGATVFNRKRDSNVLLSPAVI